MNKKYKPISILVLNTFAFTVCFSVWMLNGVLITFLTEYSVFSFTKSQMGWLFGVPVLTGALARFPVGLATDRWGGRVVFPFILFIAAVGAFIESLANGYWSFIGASLLFGLAGAGFAVGAAYTSLWFPPSRQGLVLGIFGSGMAGSAITSLIGPTLLRELTHSGQNIENWRIFPLLYVVLLVFTAALFLIFAENKKPEQSKNQRITDQLKFLSNVRIWRFGLYYFLFCGGFIALSQWLIPYYLNNYSVDLATAGFFTSIFSLPSGLFRTFGGWLSDRFGARRVMFWILIFCCLGFFALMVPQMEIHAPGEGVMASSSGTICSVTSTEITVDDQCYSIVEKKMSQKDHLEETLILPKVHFWHEPLVHVGQKVEKKQLIARGNTYIFFQANIKVFTMLVFVMGAAMGIGMAAVFKFIPQYFPGNVGLVSGLVGVIGGLGGFFYPIWFGFFLSKTGFWTTSWMILFFISVLCLVWMNYVVRRS